MRRHALLAAMLVLCLALMGGCGPSRAGFEQIYTGMLQEQVFDIMGAPKNFDPKQWIYEPGLFHPAVVIDFVDGRVIRKSWGEAPAANHEPSSQPAPRTN